MSKDSESADKEYNSPPYIPESSSNPTMTTDLLTIPDFEPRISNMSGFEESNLHRPGAPGDSALHPGDSPSLSQWDVLLQNFDFDAGRFFLDDNNARWPLPPVQSNSATANAGFASMELPSQPHSLPHLDELSVPARSQILTSSPFSATALSGSMLLPIPSPPSGIQPHRLQSLVSAPEPPVSDRPLAPPPDLMFPLQGAMNWRRSAGDILDLAENRHLGSAKRKEPSSSDTSEEQQKPKRATGTTQDIHTSISKHRPQSEEIPHSMRLRERQQLGRFRSSTMPAKGRGAIATKWRPTIRGPAANLWDPRPSHRDRGKQISLDVEHEESEPKSPGAIVLAASASTKDLGSSLLGSDKQGPSRQKVAYRVRTNALARQRSLSEPPSLPNATFTDAREAAHGSDTPAIGEAKRPDQALSKADEVVPAQEDVPSGFTLGARAPGAPVSLGPDEMVVNSVKMAAFLDQLQTIQAKMQIYQIQRESDKLQLSTVQKAASLLQQTVTELNQLKLEDEQQTQLTEKTEEIQALLSSVSLRTAPSNPRAAGPSQQNRLSASQSASAGGASFLASGTQSELTLTPATTATSIGKAGASTPPSTDLDSEAR